MLQRRLQKLASVGVSCWSFLPRSEAEKKTEDKTTVADKTTVVAKSCYFGKCWLSKAVRSRAELSEEA